MPAKRRVAHKRHVVRHHVKRARASSMTKTLKRLWVKSKKADKLRVAKKPGKRVSRKTHRTYYEYRANRSDRNPRVRL